jgi:Mg-chelatase subunit ChlD
MACAGTDDAVTATGSGVFDAGIGSNTTLDASAIPVLSPSPPSQSSTARDGGNPLCEKRVVRAQSVIPEVLIVLDKSASMAAGLRWDPSRLAVEKLVSDFDNRVAFGLSIFPGGGALGLCDPGVLDVPLKVGNAAAITQRIDSDTPFGITPTAQTLDNALKYMGNRQVELDGPGRPPGYVLLVTDGQPNCPDLDHLDPVQSSVNAVTALRQAQVKTFVIGYDIGLGGDTMNQLAAAGGTDHYYPVENQQDLAQAFAEISKGIVSCTFELSETPPDPRYVRVVLDGKTVVLNQTDGWVITGKVVTLRGGSCAALRDGHEHQLESQVECTPVLLL